MSSREKKIAILFSILDVIIMAVIVVFYLQLDRKEPKIDFTNQNKDVVYSREMTTKELLEGVTASDNVDGDVSDRVVIEKIVENNNSVVVYYAVSDKAGNVHKASSVFKK